MTNNRRMEHRWHTLIRNLLDTGMTQAQVAVAIGVTQGAVSQVLNSGGKRGFGFTAGNALIHLHSQRCPSVVASKRPPLIWPDVPPTRDLSAAAPQPRENPDAYSPAAGEYQEHAHE